MKKHYDGQTDYLLISNIPAKFRSSDLRHHFSDFIESGGFSCFHFRHRQDVTCSSVGGGSGRLTKSRGSAGTTSHSDDSLGYADVDVEKSCVSSSVQASSTSGRRSRSGQCETERDSKRESDAACCVVCMSDGRTKELFNRYNKKNWMNSDGLSLKTICYISSINIADKSQGISNPLHKFPTRADKRKLCSDWTTLSLADLLGLPELRPPKIMPRGNVGTPTKHFLRLIQRCRLPPPIIAKLGLVFPRSRSNRRYGAVSFTYMTGNDAAAAAAVGNAGSNNENVTRNNDDADISTEVKSKCVRTEASTGGGRAAAAAAAGISMSRREKECTSSKIDARACEESHTCGSRSSGLCSSACQSTVTCRKCRRSGDRWGRERKADGKREGGEEEEKGGSESDECEEWERYESLHDDPSNRERNKERLFEEDMEVVWEKGGSGLVWYTDAQYWDQADGDEEEKDVDDWDIDCAVYYDSECGGDKDARDFVTMLRDGRRRSGFECDVEYKSRTRSRNKSSVNVAAFDHCNKGVARSVMVKQGWSEGQALGRSSVKGLTEALEAEGQAPWDKKGLGYRGEKILHMTHRAVNCVTLRDQSKIISSVEEDSLRDQLNSSLRPPARNQTIISTIYDDPQVTDPPQQLLRRQEPYHLKHRSGSLRFVKSSEPWRPSSSQLV